MMPLSNDSDSNLAKQDSGHPGDSKPSPPEIGAVAGNNSDTLSFRHKQLIQDQLSSINLLLGPNNLEKEKTVISQRPVAAPHEFYRSIPLGDLAEMLEGRQLDHFSVQQIIGGGGMGAVFRGIDQRLDRTVAIKVIPASKRDPETLRRFQLEAQAAARLDHPNIARVFYVGEADQWNYIVFEFIDGVNIRDLVDMEGPLSIDDAVFYTRQIAEALQHAHEREVVHRDIKPSNILVTATGMAKLVDMGLARDTSLDKSTGEQTASGVTLGTFDYISPEQARNPRDADVRSDLYSLGCTLFYMLTGHPPFPEGTALQKLLNHGSLPPPDPRGWREDISDQLYEIMMKLMAKRPSDRYQRPIELVNDLLLLAELENLPRSLGPSTITLSPSFAHPTLVETHLPWLVAAIVLLGSTLWLHSQMSLSTGFAFPTLSFAEEAETGGNLNSSDNSKAIPAPSASQSTSGVTTDRAPIDATPESLPPIDANESNPTFGNSASLPTGANNSNSVPATADNPALPSTPIRTAAIVVASAQPADVPYERWEPSLARAIQRVAGISGAIEIELRGTVVLDRPIELAGFSQLLLRGSTPTALLEISRGTLNATSSDSPSIRISESNLLLDSLKVRVLGNDLTKPLRTVFQLNGQSSLKCSAVEFTIQGDRSGSNHLFVSGEKSVDSQRQMTMAYQGTQITLDRCVVRGLTSLIQVNQMLPSGNSAVQVSVSNSLIAITGRVIDFFGATGDIGIENLVRVFCDRSTFVSADGFAQLNYVGTGMPVTGLARTSSACVFWSLVGVPHFRLSGANCDPAEHPDQLLLQGVDNAYDQNLEYLCAFTGEEARTTQRTLPEAQQEGWYAERSTERVIRWKGSQPNISLFLESKPADFQLISSHFVPGYQTTSLSTP